MKRLVLLGTVLMGVMLLSVPLVHSDTVDLTEGITLDATVGAVTGLTVVDETDGDGAVPFGSITEEFQIADEYIEVTAVSNYGSWGVETYTDNFATQPDTTTWGFAYGGLIDAGNETKIPLGWSAYDTAGCDTAANPGETSPANRWTYVKDKRDVDDPSTTGEDEDESWGARGGYCNIAWGVPGNSYVVNPLGAGDPIYTDPMNDNNLYFYLETAALAVPGSYSSTIYFDLYHE